jgi:hypothetical protein
MKKMGSELGEDMGEDWDQMVDEAVEEEGDAAPGAGDADSSGAGDDL